MEVKVVSRGGQGCVISDHVMRCVRLVCFPEGRAGGFAGSVSPSRDAMSYSCQMDWLVGEVIFSFFTVVAAL